MPRPAPRLHCSRTLLPCAVTPAPPRPAPPRLHLRPLYASAHPSTPPPHPPFRGLPRPCRAALARTPISVLARPASPTRGRQSPVHWHRRPVPHLPAPPRTFLSARLTRSASIAQLYPLPAPVLLHHSGAVKPLHADTLAASHIHLATAPHSLAIPAAAWTRPCAMYLPLRSRCPGLLLCHAGPLPRCALPAPSVLRSLLASLYPRPPHISSPLQLRASPAPRLHRLRPALCTPTRASRVVSASSDPPYRIPSSTSGPPTHHPLHHNRLLAALPWRDSS
ncbi:hypothetical protein B0H14DRAFT_1278746 [Mycena olivaceomarginata]|nr:hypothetical protein B0H14DRAFT_1278746 [Mycena olivaceomarginata]